MSQARHLAKLRALTEIVLEARLGDLRAVAQARHNTITKIEGLHVSTPLVGETVGIADALAALNFQVWAEARRTELTQTLARQTAQWLDSREQARIAFGKATSFEKLVEKTRKNRRLSNQ